jgi:prepilin-type N-terminal cleavage/methylation domain-containing protein
MKLPGDRLTARRAGFSLLEVLIAMFVLSIGAASVLALFAAAASTHRRALDRTHAALVAERILAEIQGRYTPGKSAEELREELVKELPAQVGDYAWEAFVFHPAGESSPRRGRDESDRRAEWEEQELFARVLVRWKQSGQARAMTFQTVLLPRNGTLPPAESRGRRMSWR